MPYYMGVDAWYRAYAHRLRGLVRSWGRCGAPVDADDIVHDAFVSLATQLSTVDNPGAWLITVARRNLARAREESTQVAHADAGDILRVGQTPVRWTSLARQADIEISLEVREALRAVAKLPDGQRISMYLSQVEGWTHAEIGEYLGVAPATVAVHVHRARSALWEEVVLDQLMWEEDFEDELIRADARIRRQGITMGSNIVRPSVWVWCQCWPGEPQRWLTGRAAEADNA